MIGWFKFGEFWKQSRIRLTLVVMIIEWSCASAVSYLVFFELKYLKGDMFINTIAVGCACMIANFTGNCMAKKLGAKRTFIYCWATSLCLFGVILLIQMQTSKQLADWLMPPLLLLVVLGI